MTEGRNHGDGPRLAMGFREFVVLIAALMSVNAIAIDSMLPALPAIGRALHVVTENQSQWIISAFLLGLGGAQIVYGPLADRYGRRPVVLLGTLMFGATSVVAAVATTLPLMIAARVAQGIAAAASRVVAVSIVRDCYSGRDMARIVSLAFVVLLIVPIIGPSLGQLLLLVAPWRMLFVIFGLFGLAVSTWVWLRLPETLHPEYRIAIAPRAVVHAFGLVLSNRSSVGYTLANTLVFGSMMGFINSSQQVFADTFHEARLFPIIFAGAASAMAVSFYLNSHLVARLGTRMLSHSATLAMVSITLTHLLIVLAGHENIWIFSLCQAAIMACVGLAGPNYGAMAMEDMGEVAGTASAAQGFVSTIGGALVGIAIGQSFDGSSRPVAIGFALCSCAALASILYAERYRLFRPHHPRSDTPHPAPEWH
jgi:DHA1 family bicyclomycin/chloramphenicol resistance-like MFS transporter